MHIFVVCYFLHFFSLFLFSPLLYKLWSVCENIQIFFLSFPNSYRNALIQWQRWSRGHKARGLEHKKIRGQGQGQPYRGQTLLRPRTGMLEAKAKHQEHKRKCSPKKKVFRKNFRRSPEKTVFQKIFQTLHKLLMTQKIVLPSSRGQGNFRGLETSRLRTSKWVLEDSTSVTMVHHYSKALHGNVCHNKS